METAWLVFGAICVGVALGVFIAWFYHYMDKRDKQRQKSVSPALIEGVRDVVEALEIPVFLVDQSNNVFVSSPSARGMGLVTVDRIRMLELADILEKMRDAQREPLTYELDTARDSEGDVPLVLTVRVTKFTGKFDLVVVTDKTEIKGLDEMRRDFVANVSHELKTPIGAVSILSDALVEAADDPEQVKKFAEQLAQQASRLGSLTAEIIELSKLQAAGALAQLELIDVDSLIDDSVEQHRIAANAKRVKIAIGGDEGCRIYGDLPRLTIVINNLLSNALQYSPEGTRIGIGVAKKRNWIEIAVTDQGIGMSAEEVDRVFERFYRTDQARSRSTGGTGLGLSIVKHIVANHGGEVKVWSKLNVGSTFTVRLPSAEPLPKPKKPRKKSVPKKTATKNSSAKKSGKKAK